MTQYRGFELFDDVEDSEARNQNRAIVLANISDDNAKKKIISLKGGALILGYFNEVAIEDRNDVRGRYAVEMKKRGWVITAG